MAAAEHEDVAAMSKVKQEQEFSFGPPMKNDCTLALSTPMIEFLGKITGDSYETLGHIVGYSEGPLRCVKAAVVPLHEAHCAHTCTEDDSKAALDLVSTAVKHVRDHIWAVPLMGGKPVEILGGFHCHPSQHPALSKADLLSLRSLNDPLAIEIIICPSSNVFSVVRLTPLGYREAQKDLDANGGYVRGVPFKSRAKSIIGDICELPLGHIPSPYQPTAEELRACRDDNDEDDEDDGEDPDPLWYTYITFQQGGMIPHDESTFVLDIRRWCCVTVPQGIATNVKCIVPVELDDEPLKQVDVLKASSASAVAELAGMKTADVSYGHSSSKAPTRSATMPPQASQSGAPIEPTALPLSQRFGCPQTHSVADFLPPQELQRDTAAAADQKMKDISKQQQPEQEADKNFFISDTPVADTAKPRDTDVRSSVTYGDSSSSGGAAMASTGLQQSSEAIDEPTALSTSTTEYGKGGTRL